MRKNFIFALGAILTVALSVTQAFGAVYYVATDGSDSAAGTKDKPFASRSEERRCQFCFETAMVDQHILYCISCHW